MSAHSSRSSIVFGTVLIALGVLLLFDGPSLFEIIRWIFRFWPLGLIALGLYLVMGNRGYDGHEHHRAAKMASMEADTAGTLYRDSFLGDLRVKLPRQGFNGGVVKTMVGSVVIDASQIEMTPGECQLFLNSGVGDVHVDLQPGLAVKVKAHVMLGDIKIFDQKADGFNQEMVYQTPRYEEASSQLVLICRVGMGDIKVF